MIGSSFLVLPLSSLQIEEQLEESESSAFDELGQLGEEIDFFTAGEITVVVNQKRELKRTNKQCPAVKRIQYATRGKKQNYCEAEVPDDDHYICE